LTYAAGVLLGASTSGDGSSILGGFAIVLGLIGLYFFPSIVASWRDHQVATVVIVNLFLGWTVVGWVVALAIAAGNSVPAAQPVAIAAPHL
jgi:Superinfection immunity protein